MKIKPFEEFVGEDLVVSYIGIRADENREGYISKKDTIKAVFPFIEDGLVRDDIFHILEDSVGIPEYYKWRSRSGCYFCFFQRQDEWLGLKRNHPELFERAREYEQRMRTTGEEGKEIIRGDASRYNGSKMLQEIRRVATQPVQLIHRHLLHKAILANADLMMTARSEMVRQKAADTLIRELKPAEDATIKIDVNDGATSAIEELRKAGQELAAAQREAALAGVPMKQIAAARIFSNDDEDVIDVEPEPATDD